uniref:Putative ribonuclease H-like domain-containing protein n=1 Tax=Tanacetum cinerariifolium TaxID=118510 RepID=A0A6L2LU46_TANCI|nr:putative ribonuclease H-like domain-containing protein [Tanacetum cinerariifolium]
MDLQDKRVIDSGCSRHMTGNMSYLTNYKEIDEGYVTFGGNLKGGKIIGKDDYSRFTWVFFLATKNETSGILKSFITRIENLVDQKVKVIRCDNGTEFKNREMNQFCEMKGILRQFSVARTPQKNGVVDKRNMTLIEAARTMLADSKLPTTFWAEAVNIACKAFRVFNSRTRIVEEKLHIKFSENTPNVVGTQSNGFVVTEASDNAGQARKETEPIKDYILLPLWTADPLFSQDPKNNELPIDLNMPALKDVSTFNFLSDDGTMADMNNLDTTIQLNPTPTTRIHKDHPLDQVIRDLHLATQTRNMLKNLVEQWFMDVKSVFLYGKIEEEVYVCQPLGFEDLDFPDRVYKVKKALYGLHQAPKAWFIEVKNASTPMETQKPLLKDEDREEVDVHMYKSMIGSLMYLTSLKPNIMFVVYACARYQVNPKVSHLHAVKRIFRASLDRKSTTGGCQYLWCRLISWQCKKQTVVANSTIKAKYVAALSCYGQVLWI